MKKNTYRGILLLVLAVVILATVLVQHFLGREHRRCQTSSGKRKTGRRGTSGKNHRGTMDAETRDPNI